ncbi:hypothetical protein LCGC14_1121030 [marine sediment metagenome]|uniref:Uncharacterized protein n=1 Tax=marine sediment metagenome TaxID=412755 RepID=A0A0F9M3Y5_9ZZZZ
MKKVSRMGGCGTASDWARVGLITEGSPVLPPTIYDEMGED